MSSVRPKNLILPALTSLVLAVALTACINANPNSTVAPPAEPQTSAPATGEPAITPDPGDGNGQSDGNGSKPSVPLPRLPVGGNGEFVDQTENLQCANVSWIVEQGGAAELQSGIRIVITGFRLDKHSFRFTRNGCEDVAPSCIGYVFTSKSGNPACALAVHTRRPLTQAPDPQLGIAGTVECVDVSVSTCQDFIQAAKERSGSVSLAVPSLDPTEGPSNAQPTDTPDGEQDKTNDQGQTSTESPSPSPTSSEQSASNSES